MEGHAVLVIAGAQPQVVGGDGADLADLQHRGQAVFYVIEGVPGGDGVRGGEQVLGLEFVAGTGPEPGPEVREPVVPPAGHAELPGAGIRRRAGDRIARLVCGNSSEPWFLCD